MPATKKSSALSDIEKEALRETMKERKRQPKAGSPEEREQGEKDVKAKIAEMKPADRAMATKIHEIIASTAPELVPKTYYGMPAYAKDGKVILFFQSKDKFKVRYSTLGFQPEAKLDDGTMWPTSFALMELDAANEKRLTELVKKAVS